MRKPISASATLPSIRYETDVLFGCKSFKAWVVLSSHRRRPGSVLRLRDHEIRRVPRVQYPGQHAGLYLARVPGDAMQAPARLVESLARLEHLGRLIVDRPLVLTLQHIP